MFKKKNLSIKGNPIKYKENSMVSQAKSLIVAGGGQAMKRPMEILGEAEEKLGRG
jgi:hypothetical protein